MKIKKYIALITALVFTHGVQAQEMRVGSWLSPSHPMNAEVLPTWGKWISDATNGEIELKIVYHKGHPKDVFGLTEDGVYDAGWSYHGYILGRFKLTSIVELPRLGAGGQAASVAHWRIHQKYLAKANEHDGLELVGLFTHGPGQIMMREPIKNIGDMKGKKIRVGGGIQGNIAKLMGVTAVPAPGSKVYEILSSGVADGVFMPIGEQKTLKLAEVAPFIFQYPGNGMYLGSFSIFLNPDFLESLSEENQAAIKKISGEKLSAFAGKIWAENDANGIAAAKAAGNTIYKATASDVEAFDTLTKNLEDEWLMNVKDRNVDAKKALHELRKTAREY